MLGHLVEEEPRRDPLAHQPALHVGERDDHGVDITGGYQSLELVPRQRRLAFSAARAMVFRHQVLVRRTISAANWAVDSCALRRASNSTTR